MIREAVLSRRGSAVMVTVAAVSGLVAAVGLYNRFAKHNAASAFQKELATAVIANQPLPRGTTLSKDLLEATQFPRQELGQGAFSDTRLLIGRRVREAIPEGAVIRETALLSAEPRVIAEVPTGFRAVGVFVDARGGIQQLLRAGDHVDAVVTMDDEEGVTASRVLLQDIEILAVASNSEASSTFTSRPGSGPVWTPVTVSVTPADAERLSLAMQAGTIQLLLRSAADAKRVATSGVTKDTLLPQGSLGQRVISAGGSEDTAYQVVEIIKGNARHRQRFESGTQTAALGSEASTPSPVFPATTTTEGAPE